MNRSFRVSIPRLVATLALVASGLACLRAQESTSSPKLFPPDSPEHQALTAAGPYLLNEDFYLRNDYWKGAVTTKSGTAMRLQFFKGNTYRLFFGAAKDQLPEGATLHLHIFDPKNKEVDKASGKEGDAAAVLNFKNQKTGLYLILMRIEVADPKAPADEESPAIPAVLFYGWE